MAVRGVNKVIADIKQFGAEAERKIAAETEAIAMQIEMDAKRLAPVNFGKLQQSISRKKINPTNYKVTVNEFYGAYVEFGTGKQFKPHAEWNDIASQFKGPTGRSFADGVESIEIWLRAKGGDPKDAKWVLLNILMNGVQAQPFLYPAFVKGRNDYKTNLEKLLKRLKRNI